MWTRERYLPLYSPFTPWGSQETWPWDHKCRKADPWHLTCAAGQCWTRLQGWHGGGGALLVNNPELRYFSGPDPGLWTGQPQDIPHQWTAGVYEEAGPTDPKVQDIWEKSQWNSSIDRIAEARVLVPDQQVIPMNICKQMWTKGYIVGHIVTHYSFHNENFFLFFLGWGSLQGQKVGMRG